MFGLGLERERDQALDLLVLDPARGPGARRVHQSVQPIGREAGPAPVVTLGRLERHPC
jgi:hypothetical protein